MGTRFSHLATTLSDSQFLKRKGFNGTSYLHFGAFSPIEYKYRYDRQFGYIMLVVRK